MLNFTVGPVQMFDNTKRMGVKDIPYFRTEEFSDIMLENERLIKKFLNAPEQSRAVFLTGSGTAGMEAVVMSMLNNRDKALVINGGSFGQRFCDLCDLYQIPYTAVSLEMGEGISADKLATYEGQNYTALLVNLHETSTGVLYDLNVLEKFCRKEKMLLIVDAISAFIADEIDMEKFGIDAVIIGSQKALALPPGIAIVAVSNKAIQRIEKNNVPGFYLNLQKALKDGERGQTPFTPAVGILLQLHERLKNIDEVGIENERKKIRDIAEYFRARIQEFPFSFVTDTPSNAVTSLRTKEVISAYKIFEILKDEYGIWVCPNGGKMKEHIFRVGHIGNLKHADIDCLIEALEDLRRRGII